MPDELSPYDYQPATTSAIAERKVDDQGRILPQFRDEVLRAGMQLDAEGRPMMNGRYISPVAFGGSMPDSGGGFLHQRAQWNAEKGRFETPINWGNVLSAGVGGVLAAGALPAILGAGAGGGAAGGATSTGAAGSAAGVLPSTAIGTGMVPTIAGGTGLGAGAAGGSVATGGSILGKLGGLIRGKGTLGAIGEAIGKSTSAAGNTRRADIDTNVGAQSAYNNALVQRAQLEQQQRHQALADIYRQNAAVNPTRSPFNIAPRPAMTPGLQQTLSGLEQQALARLQQAPQYATTGMAPLEQFRSKPGVLERIGGYAGPIASIGGILRDGGR